MKVRRGKTFRATRCASCRVIIEADHTTITMRPRTGNRATYHYHPVCWARDLKEAADVLQAETKGADRENL